MSIKLLSMESGVAFGFGALDAAVDAKAGTTNWGSGALNQRWSLVLELAGVGAALFGSKVGLHSSEIKTPVGLVSLGLLGRRATRYAMASGGVQNLFRPGSWSGLGGEGGEGGKGDGDSSNILQLASGGVGGKFDRVPGRGGYPTYPPTAELPGIAG